jgi:4-nitrophenyl phosphatase
LDTINLYQPTIDVQISISSWKQQAVGTLRLEYNPFMKQYDNFIFDMDGVLWRGMEPMDKLADLFALLRARGLGHVMATNNASKTPAQYVEKLAKLGVPVEAWQILSSAETTASYLAQNYPEGTHVYVVGGDGLHLGIRAKGLNVINRQGQFNGIIQPSDIKAQLHSADIVVVGFTPNATYADLAAATYYVNNGARFVGSNPDVTFPSEIGRLPGAGALIAVVEIATGVKPTIIGKPERYIFDEAIRRLHADPASTLMVGDRLNTDIVGAHNAGLSTLLVLSGISTSAEATTATVQPTHILDNIAALYHSLL